MQIAGFGGGGCAAASSVKRRAASSPVTSSCGSLGVTGPAVIEMLLNLLFALTSEVSDLGASGWYEGTAAPTISRLSRAAKRCVALAAPYSVIAICHGMPASQSVMAGLRS